jgi:hypothetical protein
MNQMLAQFGGSSFGGPPPIFMFFFVAIFVLVIGGILFNIGKGVTEWADNNAQPERLDDAEIVSKRTEVSGGEKSTSTTYFATFELVGGERKELEVTGRDFGQFAEGDRGQLTHQGTRYLGFARQRERPEITVAPAASLPNLTCDYCGSAIPSGQIKCASCGWTWKPKADESALTT